MASLQDQLLGAGLINKKKAKRIKAEKYQAIKKSKQNNAEITNEAEELAKQARKEQQLKSQALNEQRKREAEKKAITAQIRQIIEMNSIEKSNDTDATVTYNFNDNNVIKSLHVSQHNCNLISQGRLAIAKLEETYHLIASEAANKIKERDDSTIILLNTASAEATKHTDEDDPYADYQIPDDLMW